MAKKTTEHDALKGVDLLLEALSPEERQRVFDWIVLKYKVSPSTTGSNPNPGSTTGAGQFTTSQIPNNAKVKDFIALKKPDGFYERIACLAYYLEKFDGKDGVKTGDIVKANTDARQTKLPHSTMYVNNATTLYGYLIASGKGKKTVSARGEALVDALPDREKVKAALEAHPIKKRSKNKKNKKS